MKKKIIIGAIVVAAVGGVMFGIYKYQNADSNANATAPVIELQTTEFATDTLESMGDLTSYVVSATAYDGTDLTDQVLVGTYETDDETIYELVYTVVDADGREGEATMTVHTGCVYFGNYDPELGTGVVSSETEDPNVIEIGEGTGTVTTRTAEFLASSYNGSMEEALNAAKAYAATLSGKYKIVASSTDDGQAASSYYVIRIIEAE